MKRFTARILVMLMVASSAAISVAQDNSTSPGSIVVTGDRAKQAETAAEQAKAITPQPAAQNPLPHHYDPICIKMFGIDPAYGDLMAERIRQNAMVLKQQVSKPGCQPNVWIGFVSNSKEEVKRLRKKEPAMFAELTSYEIDRIFGGSGGAQVWHATELRSADGRPIPIVELNIGTGASARKVEAGYNSQYQGGRLVSPIRNDINGTIVVFDRARANGKTVQQLADYATMRILAPVQDFATFPEHGMPTILTLFATGGEPPDGLTEFDWAYLSAFYKLDFGAKASAVHDATQKAVLDGTGQSLREKSATN